MKNDRRKLDILPTDKEELAELHGALSQLVLILRLATTLDRRGKGPSDIEKPLKLELIKGGKNLK